MLLTEFILHRKGLLSNPLVSENNQDKKGVVFVFPTKANLNGSHGSIVRSFNGLEQTNGTHWTPNIYAWGKSKSGSVSGFEEHNLNAINTFVIDIDFSVNRKPDIDYIINLCSVVLQALPTIIISTPKGYQVYLVLDDPSYISSANNFKSLYTAKRISENLRRAFYEEEKATDTGCNHFGIFRRPNEQNTVFFDERFTFAFSDLMKWSIKYDRKTNKFRKNKLRLITNKNHQYPQVKESWFDQLLHADNIDSGNGLGRNNTVLTLSLACKQSEYDEEETYNLMDEFNSRLLNPLTDREIRRIVKSAYRKSYTGASREYIQILTETWLGTRPQFASSVKHWYKFKKTRQERTYSHDEEWISDFKKYLTKTISNQKGYVKTTWKEVQRDLSIPKTTLKRIVNKLKGQDIILETKRGRRGYVKITTKNVLLRAISVNKKLYKLLLLEFSKAAKFVWKELQQTRVVSRVKQDTKLIGGINEPLSFNYRWGSLEGDNHAAPSG